MRPQGLRGPDPGGREDWDPGSGPVAARDRTEGAGPAGRQGRGSAAGRACEKAGEREWWGREGARVAVHVP